MKYILEKKDFYKIGDKVLIEYWYNDMITIVKIIEIIGRKYKISHDVPESKIKNAPTEIITGGDIIDLAK